ncbi:hypothetical protein WN943_015715 [Citrus x changshan-huyou]
MWVLGEFWFLYEFFMDVSLVPLVAVYPIIVMATLWMFTDKFSLSYAGDIMSSDVDSEADSDIAYEIVDVVETGSYSDSEDGCPDESGDELPTLTGGANEQAPIPSENNPSQSHLHGEIGTAEGQTTNYEVLKSMDVVGKDKQGFRSQKFLARDNRKREARPITRTGCEVEFRIGAKQGENGWVCTHFNGKHNHPLTPPQQVHYIRSHRRITEPDLAAASSLNKVGVRPSQIHEYMVERCDGQPMLMTHMKPFESATADVYTRPIFRLVRDQILQEGMHIAVQVSCEEKSKSFTVKKWKVSDEEWRVNIQGKWDNVSCDCLMIETLGIPCSHIFAVMKVENVDSIPHSMILARWTKKPKLGLSSEVQCTLRQHYMSVDARMGSLHAACRTLQKVAAKSCEAYELAIAGIHKLSMQLEPMSCEIAKEKPKGNLGRRFDVNDPVVVLTKGCGKKPKMGPSQQRKCSRCGNGGHTVRKCKIIIQPDGDHNDNPNQSNQFMGENTALPATRRSGITDKGKEHNRTNEYDQHCLQQSHNSRATSSNSWY